MKTTWKQRAYYFKKKAIKNSTPSEACFWSYIQLCYTGYKFTRQAVIGPYRPDYVCFDLKVIVEIDGGYHFTKEQRLKDAKREKYFINKGFSFKRFTNEQVNNNAMECVLELMNYCDTKNDDLELNVPIRYQKGRSPQGRKYETTR